MARRKFQEGDLVFLTEKAPKRILSGIKKHGFGKPPKFVVVTYNEDWKEYTIKCLNNNVVSFSIQPSYISTRQQKINFLMGKNFYPLKRDWETPMKTYKKGHKETSIGWAKILKITPVRFKKMIEKGEFDEWFSSELESSL